MVALVQVIRLSGRFAVTVVTNNVERYVSDRLIADEKVAKKAAETFAQQHETRIEERVKLPRSGFSVGIVELHKRWYPVQLFSETNRVILHMGGIGLEDTKEAALRKAQILYGSSREEIHKNLENGLLNNPLSPDDLSRVELVGKAPSEGESAS